MLIIVFAALGFGSIAGAAALCASGPVAAGVAAMLGGSLAGLVAGLCLMRETSEQGTRADGVPAKTVAASRAA
ncbi:hypothetical protein DA075_24410 [Methylobacterium currus]|uniref:Uncharacterized protein n=1 Tax=Methylobacterium currus TaxID=2051553 RepID=A0A2R4WQ62_9HYPH|nr:hypothetical protein [Methylobacterium currus]AWB23645.1 hypothetical protein DA075_24410 [Methylobacterium currus]